MCDSIFQDAAFRMFTVVGFVLLFMIQPEIEDHH